MSSEAGSFGHDHGGQVAERGGKWDLNFPLDRIRNARPGGFWSRADLVCRLETFLRCRILHTSSNGAMAVGGGHQIVPFQNDQFAAARRMLARAFAEYPLFLYAVADVRRRTRGVDALYAAILRDALRHGEVLTTSSGEGISCWLPPGKGLPTFAREMRAGILGLPFAFGFASFRLLLSYDRVARELHQRYASEPHWFLATIGVEPVRQGCGLGSSLMDPILIKADAQKMPCYLETHSPQNVTLYERHGFQVAERVSVASHPIPIWSMVRPPRAAP